MELQQEVGECNRCRETSSQIKTPHQQKQNNFATAKPSLQYAVV